MRRIGPAHPPSSPQDINPYLPFNSLLKRGRGGPKLPQSHKSLDSLSCLPYSFLSFKIKRNLLFRKALASSRTFAGGRAAAHGSGPGSSTLNAGASSSPQPRNHRGGHDDRSGAGMRKQHPPERAASFHARTTPALAPEHRLIRRPKTQPDLLGPRGAWGRASTPPLVPAKVLVNVTLQRSLGPVQVMASTEWTVCDLIAATLQRYLKEGRRPSPPAADPSAYGLHYSQFSLECLDPKEKLIGLGSRNFFLCLKPAPEITQAAGEAAASSATATGSCSKQAGKASKPGISWLSFMDCLP